MRTTPKLQSARETKPVTRSQAGERLRRLWAAPLSTSGIRGGARSFLSFALIGAACTVAFIGLYALGRVYLDPLAANIVALTLTMTFNFGANRRFTFEPNGDPLALQSARYGAAYLLGLGASTLTLHLALSLVHEPRRLIETFLAVGSGGVATVIRFALMSAWVFRHGVDRPLR
ncbi:MAG: GtrA family protein [Dehalococcoidia bacterium]|nr:GtrA family protein [Dehalococcoidia bacterium]NUQ56071.1 GtrA family protein [Dehalococcoidia bacterium]